MARTLWYTRCPVATATGVALETGLFDAEFADGTVAFRNIKELGRDTMLKSHFDHHLDDSVREGGAVPPIWARSRGGRHGAARAHLRARLAGVSGARRFGYPPLHGLGRPALLAAAAPEAADRFHARQHRRGFLCALAEYGMTAGDVQFVDTAIDDDFKEAANPDTGAERKAFEATMFDHETRALLDGRVDVVFTKNVQSARLLRLFGDRLRCIVRPARRARP